MSRAAPGCLTLKAVMLYWSQDVVGIHLTYKEKIERHFFQSGRKCDRGKNDTWREICYFFLLVVKSGSGRDFDNWYNMGVYH